jgi:hypothetical protein
MVGYVSPPCSYSNHLGKIKLQERYSKQLKPVTYKLESIPRSIASVLEPTLTSIAAPHAAIPTALAALTSNTSDAIWPQLPTNEFATPQTAAPLTIEDTATPISSLEVPQSSMVLGDLATFCTNLIGSGDKDDADTTFGSYTKPGQPGIFYIATKPVLIAGNDLTH